MPSAVYPKALEAILDDTIALATVNVKAGLIDFDDESAGGVITAATNASPISITTTAVHGLTTGDKVMVARVGGNTNANGVWVVTVVNTTTYTLDGSTGNAAFTAGGYTIDLTKTFLSDLAATALVASSANLATKTFLNGLFDAADTTFTGASGDPCEGFITYHDTAVAATSRLLSISSRNAADSVEGDNFSVAPNGGDVNLQFSGSGIFSLATPTGSRF